MGAHASLIPAHARLYAGMAAALDAQRLLAEQRDALWSVGTAATEAGTVAEALESIVRLAPGALGVHSCSVALTTDTPTLWCWPRRPAGGRPGGRFVLRADRVPTMSHAHELFVGAAGAAPLGEVVRRVLAALPIADEGKPVVVAAERGEAVAVPLLNDQTVALAMALHEVCFNAVTHGIAIGGTPHVSAALAGNGQTLVVEVTDEGRGLSAAGDEDLFGPLPRPTRRPGPARGSRWSTGSSGGHCGARSS